MRHDSRPDGDAALELWRAFQSQQSSRLADTLPPEIHLHQHHHAAPSPPPAPVTRHRPAPVPTYRRELPHPLITALYMLMVSVALALPLAVIAAIVGASNHPQVIYQQQPSRGGW